MLSKIKVRLKKLKNDSSILSRKAGQKWPYFRKNPMVFILVLKILLFFCFVFFLDYVYSVSTFRFWQMGTISVRYSIGKLNHTIRKVPDIFLRCRLRSKHLLHTILPSFSSALTRYFIIGKWSGSLSNLSFFSYPQ